MKKQFTIIAAKPLFEFNQYNFSFVPDLDTAIPLIRFANVSYLKYYSVID